MVLACTYTVLIDVPSPMQHPDGVDARADDHDKLYSQNDVVAANKDGAVAVRAAHCLRVAGRVEADERRAAVTDEGVLVDGKVHHTDQRL